MAARKRATARGKAHRFGGDWTAEKLDIVGKYLRGYTQALKNQRFTTEYIDAFAGTGYRTLREPTDDGLLSLPDLASDAAQDLLDGSARIALKTEPRFGKYVFVERSADRCRELEGLKNEFTTSG